MGTKIWRLLFVAGVLAYFLISRSRADNPPVVIDTAQLTGQPLTNALVTYQPLSYLAASNRLWTLVPWTNRTDAYGVTIIPAVIPGDYRLTIDDRRITTILTNRVPDTNATLYAANLIFGPAPVPITDLRYPSSFGSNIVAYTKNGRLEIAATGSASSGGGSASNAVGTVYTNNVSVGTGITQLGFTNGSNITVAGTVSGSRVTITIHAPGMASLVQVTNIAVIWATLSSNLSYALGANGTNYANGLAVAASNLSYQIGAAGSNLSYAVGLNGTNYTDSRAVALSNLCLVIQGLVGETNFVGNASTTNSTRFGLAWGKAGNTNLVKTLMASGAITITDDGTNLTIGASAASGEANVNGEAGKTNATHIGLVFDKASTTNRMRSVSPGYGLLATNESTNVVFALDWSTLTNGLVTLMSNGIPFLTVDTMAFGTLTVSNWAYFIGKVTNASDFYLPGITGSGAHLTIDADGKVTRTTISSGGTATFQTTNMIASATNNIVWDAGNFPNGVLWGLTNLNRLIVSNLSNPAYLSYQEDTNGTREVNLVYWSGPLLTNASKSLRPGTNANTVTTYKFLPLGTNAQAACWETNITGVPFTNSLASGGGGGGGGSSFTLVDHQIGGANSVSLASISINTVGCKLLVISASYRRGGGGTDTGPTCAGGADTPTAGTYVGGPSGNGTNQLFYVVNPTSSATYAITMTRDYIVLAAESFSYTGTTPSLDVAATGAGSDAYTTIQPGSATPASGTGLFVTGLSCVFQSAETATINSSFTITDQLLFSSGGAFGAMAYKNSSTAENPTWTSSTAGVPGGTAMMLFK